MLMLGGPRETISWGAGQLTLESSAQEELDDSTADVNPHHKD